MPGHKDKPHIVKYHPTASGVLASSSLDLTVKIWDVNKAKDMITLTDHTEQVRNSTVLCYLGLGGGGKGQQGSSIIIIGEVQVCQKDFQ